jgi:hypothetical protein
MAGLEPGRRSYRRGLVLGWSLAEVFLLILFALLFAFAALTIKWNRGELKLGVAKLEAELRAARQVIQSLRMENAKLRQENNDLRKALRNPDQISALFHKLSLCEADNVSMKQELNSLMPLDKWMNSKRLTPEQVKALAESADKYKSDAGQCHTNERYYQAQLAKFGGGADYPPCWSTRDKLRPEYIFDISLTSDGIVVRQNHLDDRVNDEKTLPLSGILFGATLSDETFGEQTDALYEYSKAHDCRFFVRVFDDTRPDEKMTYKRRLRTVEAHFYKLESTAAEGAEIESAEPPAR